MRSVSSAIWTSVLPVSAVVAELRDELLLAFLGQSHAAGEG